MRVFRAEWKPQPLLHRCTVCGKPIEPGTKYMVVPTVRRPGFKEYDRIVTRVHDFCHRGLR